jgi:Fe-S cluster assembly iron-binding protein IscA
MGDTMVGCLAPSIGKQWALRSQDFPTAEHFMDQDQNPYQAPEADSVSSEKERPSEELVRKGQQVYLAIAFFLLATELGTLSLIGGDASPARLVILLGLLMAGWRGHGWAVTLLGLGFAIGILVGGAGVIQAIGSGVPIAIGLTLLFTLVYISILLALLYSPGLKAFFRFQENQRRQRSSTTLQTENVRNIVALTAEASELGRETLKKRNYPTESVLRVIEQPGSHGSFDVQYDLPANDNRDWVGESSGVVILVAKEISDLLEGVTIDAKKGQYVFLEAEKRA